MSFGDRWDSHRSKLRNGYHDNKELQKDWTMYGEDNFEFSIIEIVNDIDTLNIKEQQYIKEYKSMNISYNIHDGGDVGINLGKHLSDETKRKIGEKNRIHMSGKKLSDETRLKMSESQKRRFSNMTDEERMAYGKMTAKYASGYTWSKESRESFSKKQQEKPNSAKYDIVTVNEIRRLYEDEKMTFKEISDKLNMNRHTVYLIATYRRWKNI